MGFPTRMIRLAIDPTHPDELYAGIEVGGLVRSLDGGVTWTDCNAPLLCGAPGAGVRHRGRRPELARLSAPGRGGGHLCPELCLGEQATCVQHGSLWRAPRDLLQVLCYYMVETCACFL